MPLASVEEWRARIGSCWRALGRLFKASKSSGKYQSYAAALSGSAMLQAVYAMMAISMIFVRHGIERSNGYIMECPRGIKSEFYYQII